MLPIKITEDIFLLGFNDRRTHLFENIWPIPHGISYNSYLIVDDKTALIDTMEKQFIDDYIDQIVSLLGDRTLDYLFTDSRWQTASTITHQDFLTESDHAAVSSIVILKKK